jgi:biotin operon repressor
MDRESSRDIAFFNILSTALNLNFVETASNFSVSLDELQGKIGLSKELILSNINKLQANGLISLKSEEGENLILDLSCSYNKLAEVFSRDEIDEILLEFDYFIKKYDTIIINDDRIHKFVEITKDKINEDSNGDLNDIIRDGIEEIFDSETVITLEKQIYDICDEADERELQIIEVILFCFYNFKNIENPFFVTLFLATIYENMEE